MRFLSSCFYQGNPTASTGTRKRGFLFRSDCRVATRNEDSPNPPTVKDKPGRGGIEMTLLGVELSAIANLAVRMAHADGHVDASEIDVIANGFRYFNVPIEQAKPLILMAMSAREEDAITIVSAMPVEHKEFIAAWLAAVVIADGVIDDREQKLLNYYGHRCGLPSLTIEQALEKVKVEQARIAQSNSRATPSAKTGCLLPLSAIVGTSVYAIYNLFV